MLSAGCFDIFPQSIDDHTVVRPLSRTVQERVVLIVSVLRYCISVPPNVLLNCSAVGVGYENSSRHYQIGVFRHDLMGVGLRFLPVSWCLFGGGRVFCENGKWQVFQLNVLSVTHARRHYQSVYCFLLCPAARIKRLLLPVGES